MNCRVPPAITGIILCYSPIAFAQDDRLTPQEALESFTVSNGLEVTTFAADPDIVSISNIDVDHRGRVWACECVNYRGNNGKRPAGDRILILDDTDGDGRSDTTTVFYQGRDIDIAMGLCVLGNKAIVSVAPEIMLLEDTDGDDRADKKTVLFTSDAVYQHDHSLHSFVFGPDGRFYGNFGNTGRNLKTPDGKIIVDSLGNEIVDDGNPYRGGMVFRCNREFRNFEVLGHNFRNNYEATVDSFGGVWQSDNDDDGNMAVRLNYILEGGNYGYLDELTGERWKAPRVGAHPDRARRHWHQNDPGVVPNVLETGNGAPTGITVYEGDLLPPVYRNQVIHCEAGPHVVWALSVTKVGAGFTAKTIDIMRSSDNNFRPVDVAVAPDGSLFVSDWYDPVVGGFKQDDIERGRIYRIAPAGHRYSPPDLEFDSPAAAADALRSPNYCARSLAWMTLHDAGAAAEEPLAVLASDENPRIRARAYWLLGRIPERESKWIDRALNDNDEDVRVVGVRLSRLLNHDVVGLVSQLSSDPSARVRAECAVQLRHYDSTAAAETWAKLAVHHKGRDRWYLEALGIGADRKWDLCMAPLKGNFRRNFVLDWQHDAEPETRHGLYYWWRARGTETPGHLASVISGIGLMNSIPEADRLKGQQRYLRAFDFQSGDLTEDALLSVGRMRHVPPEIAIGALGRISPPRLKARPRGWTRLLELLNDAELTTESIRLVRRHRLNLIYPRLLQVALQDDNEFRIDAITALLDLERTDMIAESLNSSARAIANATARVLARSLHPAATSLLLPIVTDSSFDMDVRREVARELVPSARSARELLRLVEEDRLNDEIRQAIAGRMLTHRNEGVRTAAEDVFTVPPAKNATPLPRLNDLVAMSGNVNAGRQVFQKLGKCATCHQVRGEGKSIGPDLTQTGTKLTRAALFEAILFPSAAISHNYESHIAVLKSGLAVTGILINENSDQIQLRDAEGNLRTLNRTDVEDFKRQDVSLMPADLHAALTAQELVDLVEYLVTLK